MKRLIYLSLISLVMGCGNNSNPTVVEVPENLSITSTIAGTGTMYNTDSQGGKWSQNFAAPCSISMSVYPNSTGYFTVTFPVSTTFSYVFGASSGTTTSTTFTSSSQIFQ